MDSHKMRRQFMVGMRDGLGVVWPILSVLLGMMVILGMVISLLEGWRIGDGLYFAFVSGLTIGYGDLVPKAHLSRVLAIGIGFTGILLTGLVAAVGVNALNAALKDAPKDPG
ncbi:MAG: two pore domain potassium channel family protein [Sulfuritalea sp.]|nr:two pore domain potassium channel family protein [Sulfuritalea sp.]